MIRERVVVRNNKEVVDFHSPIAVTNLLRTIAMKACTDVSDTADSTFTKSGLYEGECKNETTGHYVKVTQFDDYAEIEGNYGHKDGAIWVRDYLRERFKGHEVILRTTLYINN